MSDASLQEFADLFGIGKGSIMSWVDGEFLPNPKLRPAIIDLAKEFLDSEILTKEPVDGPQIKFYFFKLPRVKRTQLLVDLDVIPPGLVVEQLGAEMLALEKAMQNAQSKGVDFLHKIKEMFGVY